MRICSVLLLFVIAAGAQTRRVVISPDDRSVRWSDTGNVLLHLRDLPTRSTVSPGHVLSNERFTHAALSPNGRWLAISVRGNGQSWNGVVSVRTAEVIQLTFNQNEKGARCSWSPDGRHVNVEGPAEIQVYDARTGKLTERKPHTAISAAPSGTQR